MFLSLFSYVLLRQTRFHQVVRWCACASLLFLSFHVLACAFKCFCMCKMNGKPFDVAFRINAFAGVGGGGGPMPRCSQAPSLVRSVLQHGARVNTPRGDRRIPLHTAMRLPAGTKKLSITATLLVVGADIDRPGAFLPLSPRARVRLAVIECRRSYSI